jgi:hypothetical protein
VHLQCDTMRSTTRSIIVQLEPVQRQIPPTSRMDNELRHPILRALKPLAVHRRDSRLTIAVRCQDVGIVVLGDSGAVAPGGGAIDEVGFETRDVDGKLRGAFEGERGVLDEVLVDVEVETALCGFIVGDVEVDSGPLLGACLGLCMVSELRCCENHRGRNGVVHTL